MKTEYRCIICAIRATN